MSDAERHAIIGRAVEEAAAARRDHAALLAKAARYGGRLTEIALYLKSSGPVGVRYGDEIDLSDIPSPEEIREVVAETLRAKARTEELQGQLRDLGVTGD